MSVGLLLITHPQVGNIILQTARRILGDLPLRAQCLDVTQDADLTRLHSEAQKRITQLNSGDGVLIITDLFGASPANLANQFSDFDQVEIIAGLNLPMLLRACNYNTLPLNELTNKVHEGGIKGIIASNQG